MSLILPLFNFLIKNDVGFLKILKSGRALRWKKIASFHVFDLKFIQQNNYTLNVPDQFWLYF